MTRRVVITGVGIVSPLGCDLNTFWGNLAEGKSAVSKVSAFDATGFQTQIAAEVKDFDGLAAYKDPKTGGKFDRYQHFGHAAAKMALDDSGFQVESNAERAGVSLSTGIGAIISIQREAKVLQERGPRRVTPFFVPIIIPNNLSGYFSIEFGLQGPNHSVVSACATANHGIGEAFEAIRRDDADVMVAGGAEAAISELTFAGFCNMKAMSTRNDDPTAASRPWDKSRDGFVMGEGGGAVVLEELEHARRRGAKIYGELLGYGHTADAHHLTAPHPDGNGGLRSMQMALRKSKISADKVDLVNAHGTSTPLGDIGETKAIKQCFGDHAKKLMVHSSKSLFGHLLGAAGAAEMIAALMAIERGIVHPTLNQVENDPECDLDYVPNTARQKKVDVVLSNSFGFGGHNATLVFGRYQG